MASSCEGTSRVRRSIRPTRAGPTWSDSNCTGRQDTVRTFSGQNRMLGCDTLCQRVPEAVSMHPNLIAAWTSDCYLGLFDNTATVASGRPYLARRDGLIALRRMNLNEFVAATA